jgi:DNA-binding HxlR family transcriptional regulator
MTGTSASADGRYDVLAAACPTRQVVNRLGDKWTLLVVSALETEPMRFRALQRVVEGISQRMLTQTLRALERDGLVHRTVYPTAPPSVEYRLTDLGRSLSTVVAQIRHWAYGHIDQVDDARAQFDLTAAE